MPQIVIAYVDWIFTEAVDCSHPSANWAAYIWKCIIPCIDYDETDIMKMWNKQMHLYTYLLGLHKMLRYPWW